MDIGEKIRTLRRSQGWSQGELADRIGVSRQSVSKWELAEAVPDAGNIVKLCDLFAISADELLEREQSEPVPAPVPAAVRPAWKKTRTVGIVLLAVGIVIIGVLVTLSQIIPSWMEVEQYVAPQEIEMIDPNGPTEAGRMITTRVQVYSLIPFLNTYSLHWLFVGGFILVGAGIYSLVKSRRQKRYFEKGKL